MKEDKLIKEWLKELPEKEPSVDFTANVMGRIKPLAATAYKPLISKKMWAVIVIFFTALTVVLGFQEGYHHNINLPAISYPELNFSTLIQFLNLSSFTSPAISLSITAVLLLWTFLMLSQNINIQQLFNKRYLL